MTVLPRALWSWALVPLTCLLIVPGAWAQKSAADGIAEYRKMLQDGNPADLFEVKGESLWKTKRGPKSASLETCDLGKGPGVVKGAWVELPRYFTDTGKVQDLESRLVTCMERLQGFNAKDIIDTPFGKDEQNNVTALATWIAAESKGMKFNLSQAHAEELAWTAEVGHLVHERRRENALRSRLEETDAEPDEHQRDESLDAP